MGLSVHIRAVALTAATATALVGCAPPHPRASKPLTAVSRLNCPDRKGDLTRQTQSADGKSCTYATSAGDQVTLKLVALDGAGALTVLEPTEAALKSEVPNAVAAPAAAAGESDKVDIDLPGLHIHSAGHGHADVDAAGVHVNADGADLSSNSNASAVSVNAGGAGHGHGGVTVNATDGGAQVRVDESGAGIRLSYILASDTAGPHGWRVAGYEARGPHGGPLVVATILAKSHDADDLRHDVRSLLKENAGS